MTNSFVLIMTEGPFPGQRFDLKGQSVIIGRDPASNFVIDDIEVSRRHARLIVQGSGFAIEDLGSTNGTFVEDQRIRNLVPLQPGVTIRLGERISFSYEALAPDEAETRDFASTPPTSSQRMSSRAMRRGEPAPPPTPAFVSEPKVESIESLGSGQPGEPAPAQSRLRPRRKGIRLPVFSRPWMIGCGILLILGLCAGITFLWYVDANFLWCDVFGGLIPTCR
ncbi:MAG: FHA domain-containing protein [Anaerolineales bacterium]